MFKHLVDVPARHFALLARDFRILTGRSLHSSQPHSVTQVVLVAKSSHFLSVLIAVLEGLHFIAWLLCSLIMKSLYFSDESTNISSRRAVSAIEVPYTSYKMPLFQEPNASYVLGRAPTSVIKVSVYQF